jgi:hypothetical protein
VCILPSFPSLLFYFSATFQPSLHLPPHVHRQLLHSPRFKPFPDAARLRTSSNTIAQSDPPGLGRQLSKCLLRLATKLLGSSRTAKFTRNLWATYFRRPTCKRQSTDYKFEVKCVTAMQSSEAHYPHASNTSLHHIRQCKRETKLIRRVAS